ncbi:MAG: hypothetical protein QF473_20525 [Planctomycetota bacterium]|nr:hypothetical protein [Planctomycetota bacterium]
MTGDISDHYFASLQNGLDAAGNLLSRMTLAAEQSADRLQAGGNLFIAGVRPDFASEGVVRAGGLIMLKEFRPETVLTEKDTVILGWTEISNRELQIAKQIAETGARIIGIGPSHNQDSSDRIRSCVGQCLDSSLPVPRELTDAFAGSRYPLESLQNLVLLWVFTGELVGALTRRGLMPTMYQSVRVPGSRQRNLPYRPQSLHVDHEVPPIPAGKLGKTYLDELGLILRKLRDEELQAIQEAARACLRVKNHGKNILAFLVSHFPVYQAEAPGDPGFIERLEIAGGEVPTTTKLQQSIRQGDLYFFLGYYRRPVEAYQAARKAGAEIVEVITGTDGSDLPDPQPDYRIRPMWPYGDALVSVPGYDVKILPSSGIVQSAIFWAVNGTMVVENASG